MKFRRATHSALALLLAAGLGVFADSAEAKSSTPQSATTSKSGGTTHKKRSSKRARRPRGQKAPTADRISEIQQALAKDGSFTGKPNGKWDAATSEATRKFQESHGLNPTGKLDAKTLQQLGLGSQTAGAAPPMPSTTGSKLGNSPAQSARRQN